MASPFSWGDTAKTVFGACLPCLKPAARSSDDLLDTDLSSDSHPALNRIPRARPDELQGLLADADTDGEAETMSLHSNPGRGNRTNRKKKRRNKNGRSITLFGYDLFGRPAQPPIQLPSQDDDYLYRRHGTGALTPTTVVRANSNASNFDSDAAPLDANTIAALSSPTSAAAAIEAARQATHAAEEQRLKEKEERQRRRREKRELRRMAEMLANGHNDGEEFQGFQGSGNQLPSNPGSGYRRITNSMFLPGRPASDSGSGSALSGSTREGFGQFVSAPVHLNPQPEEEDNDAADFDGGLYSRRAPRGASNGGSDIQSRTSASISDKAHHFPDPRAVATHIQSHSARVNSPSQPQFPDQSVPNPEPQRKKKSKFKNKSSSRTTQSRSSTTASSIPSPSSPAFVESAQEIVSPSTVEHGQGFFDLEDELTAFREGADVEPISTSNTEFPSTRIGGEQARFPMTGFGGAGGNAKRTRDLGVFLAHRGDNNAPVGDGL